LYLCSILEVLIPIKLALMHSVYILHILGNRGRLFDEASGRANPTARYPLLPLSRREWGLDSVTVGGRSIKRELIIELRTSGLTSETG